MLSPSTALNKSKQANSQGNEAMMMMQAIFHSMPSTEVGKTEFQAVR